MKTMHLLAGEYGPEAGGVGAYSQVLVEALSRMRSVLMQEGDAELREAIRENADFILDLAARADSVSHLLEALGAREAACLRS